VFISSRTPVLAPLRLHPDFQRLRPRYRLRASSLSPPLSLPERHLRSPEMPQRLLEAVDAVSCGALCNLEDLTRPTERLDKVQPLVPLDCYRHLNPVAGWWLTTLTVMVSCCRCTLIGRELDGSPACGVQVQVQTIFTGPSTSATFAQAPG